jgi:apolipoprotein N-acyltransferase
VQTGLLPSEKIPLMGRLEEFVSPMHQWRSIFKSLASHREKRAELIALPESAVPFRMDLAAYDYAAASRLLSEEFGSEARKFFPDLAPPFSNDGRVSNAFFCQFLANYFNADLVIGLDDEEGEEYYTAAIHFSPWQDKVNRYEKRVLVPLAEYLPFSWCKSLAKAYGIESFYTPGKEAKVFPGSLPIAASICYEETFPDLIREGRLKGAAAFVNITNDNWYPNSKLPQQHFEHGKLRAVENGVPLFRACNSGVTSAVDALGRICGQLDLAKGTLFVEVPNYQIRTVYTFLGDSLIVGISVGIILFYLIYRRIEKINKRQVIKARNRK